MANDLSGTAKQLTQTLDVALMDQGTELVATLSVISGNFECKTVLMIRVKER
jgi:hypothetical protein